MRPQRKLVYDIPDNEKFRKVLIRDVIALALITIGCGIGIVITLLVSIKYNW